MARGNEFCTIVEYRLTNGGDVSRHALGSLELVRGRLEEDILKYVDRICRAQGDAYASVLVVTRELYGINEASCICRGGEVVLKEGASGCSRSDELIALLKKELQEERRAMRGGWLAKLLRRGS